MIPQSIFSKVLFTTVAVSAFAYGADTSSPSWQAKMGELSQTLQDLLPELTSSNPDVGKIKRGAKTLSSLAHAIHQSTDKGGAAVPDNDPSVSLFSSLFEKETKRAYQAIEAGHTEYSRQLLRTITGYCIACHTRHDQGPAFSGTELARKAAGMQPLERAELLAATRQFDAAIGEYRTLISDANFAQKHPIEWERGLRDALAIAVRVKKDPKLAMDFVDRIKTLPAVPEFVKAYVDKWKVSLADWQSQPESKPMTEAGLEAEAAKLLADARTLQSYPVDHSGDILYLRASSRAHDLLSRDPKGPVASRALLMEGVAYEVLSNPLVWPVHEMFYEACVRNSPHTDIAWQCYTRYEASVFFGYSGSGGMFLPSDVQLTLGELKKLAAPLKKKERAKRK